MKSEFISVTFLVIAFLFVTIMMISLVHYENLKDPSFPSAKVKTIRTDNFNRTQTINPIKWLKLFTISGVLSAIFLKLAFLFAPMK